MDVFVAIWLAFMDQLTTIGILFMLFGIMLRLLPKWGHFKWCVEVRHALIKEAELSGDFTKVSKLRNEIYAIEKKLPIQGSLLSSVGVVIFIVSFFLPIDK